MIKFQAHYRVTIYSNTDTVTITDPLTCHFNVTRGVMSDCNKATIQLYNLAPSTRDKIFQDVFTWEPEQWKYVHLEAGYGDKLSLIFKGRILQAYSRKSGGQTDVITEIQAQALDMFDCDSSYTFKAGTSKRDAFQTMAQDLLNVKLANLGSLEGTFLTDTTFDGNTMDCLNTLTGGNAFIDNGNLNCVMLNEVIDVPVPVITDDCGLLETPMRRDANLEVKMLFEPSLITGQLLEIKSGIYNNYNGQFKVLGFTHDCTISGSQGGTRTTTANLYLGPFLPQADKYISENGGFVKVRGTDVEPVTPAPVGQKWIMPCKGSISSPYGWRIHPKDKTRKFHNGIDIAVPSGTPIKAIANGTVSTVGRASGYGYWVLINHGKINGIQVTSEYGHISKWCVSKGQKVKQGQIIAYSGNTGTSTGPHCHLTIRQGSYKGKAVNPWIYISR